MAADQAKTDNSASAPAEAQDAQEQPATDAAAPPVAQDDKEPKAEAEAAKPPEKEAKAEKAPKAQKAKPADVPTEDAPPPPPVDKPKVMEAHARGKGDTGSPEVQVALLSARITNLTAHFKTHAKDNHSRRGLLKLVSRRRRLLDYLRQRHEPRYAALIKTLGLRR